MTTTRRELLELAMRAAALPGGAEFTAMWLRAQDHNHAAGQTAPPEKTQLKDRKPTFFPAEDFEALQAFTEILIPTDSTPGAKEAFCAQYIDFLMSASDGLPVQKQWRDAMATLRKVGFQAADAKGRAALIAEMARPEVDPKAKHPGYEVYRLIKQQNAFAYYTARAGMIENLEYKGNSYALNFPACTHPEHRQV